MTGDALSHMLENLQFAPDAVGMECVLGPLEARVMEVAWEEGEATIREIHRRLGGDATAAYTTVATVAHRLEGKGLLVRRMAGRSLRLRPTIPRPDFQALTLTHTLRGIVRQLRSTHARKALTHLSMADRVFLRSALEGPADHGDPAD